jgi:hypothetical protein
VGPQPEIRGGALDSDVDGHPFESVPKSPRDATMRHPGTTFWVILLYAVSTGVLLAYSVRKPYHNWDMIVYAASARALATADMGALHVSVYDELRRSVPPATYAELTRGEYRKTVSEDVEAFSEQLPLYRIRVLYNGAILLLSGLGINIFAATHGVSAISVVVGLWVVLIAFRRWVSPPWLALLPFLGLPFGLLDVAKYSTPDGLAFLMICLCMFFVVRNHGALLAVLPLCVLVRTDLIIFVALVTACVFFGLRRRRPWVALSLLVSVAAYFGTNAYYKNYGLETTYHMTFVETLSYPSRAPVHFGVNEYASALKTGVGEAATNLAFVLFAGVCGGAGYLSWKRRAALRDEVSRHLPVVLAVSILYVIVHFVAFPEIEERLFLGQYVLAVVVLLSLLRPAPRAT